MHSSSYPGRVDTRHPITWRPRRSWGSRRWAVAGVVPPGVAVVGTTLRPRPVIDISGRSVAYFCMAPRGAHAALAAHLSDAHGADVVHVSGNLADRGSLVEGLAGGGAAGVLVGVEGAGGEGG